MSGRFKTEEIATFEEIVEEIISQTEVGERAEAQREYAERIRTAWKKNQGEGQPLNPNEQAALDAWHDRGDLGPLLALAPTDSDEAVLAWLNSNDIIPLAAFVASGQPLSADARRIVVSELLGMRKPSRGKPGGAHLRWSIPLYVVTYLAECDIRKWKRDHCKKAVPSAITDQFIEARIAQTQSWAMMRGKPEVTGDQVRMLLREPKSRRL